MFNDGVYSITANKHARFQAALTYLGQPIGHAELKHSGMWSVYINDLDIFRASPPKQRAAGKFISLGAALSALWEQRFDAVAELHTKALPQTFA
ncbi:hypothetical protein [Candidatus Sororendozoicomonas aggregata]|uniref:hypothetical protein n=1 Tax=Candidatus Sororendozoicomonas aggregata TaxID=3073239 RepID=UPI002ED38CF1